MPFKKLEIIEPIVRALHNEGYTAPTPIQQQAIPVILKGRDLLGCAQTGTGKTAAFAIPILQILSAQHQSGPRHIRSLVLTPTRELAVQIADSFTAYGKHTGLKHTVVFGGVSQHSQVEALKRGVDIVVATPGRLLDLMNQRHVNLQHIQIFVLDEADRMLDMGFINDIKKVIARLPNKRQTLFFSATMPTEIRKLADNILDEPVSVEVAPPASTVDTIAQSVYMVSKQDKSALLLYLLKHHTIERSLVFARTKHGADKITRTLNRAGVKAAAIHGNKSQGARQGALNNFKDGTLRVLVATDIAARGIDVDNLTHVINYDLPNVPETYVHRIGRTGRAGASGVAISFCDGEEKPYLKDIQKAIRKTVPLVEAHPYAPGQAKPQNPAWLKEVKGEQWQDAKEAPRQKAKSSQGQPNKKKTSGNSAQGGGKKFGQPKNQSSGKKWWGKKNNAGKKKNHG